MFPQVTSGRIDPQLTNILLAYSNPMFLADQILPTVPNLKDEAGHIPQLGTSHLRVYTSKRSVYDESSHRIGFEVSNDAKYHIDYYDLDAYVPDRLQQQLQSPFDAQNIAQKTALDSLKLEREVGLAALMTSTAIITQNTTLSGSSKYTDGANSNPDSDFDTARDAVQNGIGREANAMYMSRKVANALRRHPFFLQIAQSSLNGGKAKGDALSVNGLIETLKAWYNLDYVFVGSQIKVTSQQGQATVTKGAVWGDDVVFFYRPTGPALMEPSFGYSFQLAGQNLRTSIRRHENDKGDLVRVDWAYQDKILDTNAAYLIKNAV